ncbi:hypothetical protein G6O69_23210 [Pseudenhygromyxa sp. WMMC2535]|uniref:hypothetical protein n=1 Tax=Pseudenhygromyxa sp. WMMC2535 TaxID=2712867 RepID=UPI00155438DE|nr:hypothetical protein [Pseudenhygromyxa sp. WMMC2535]NVB40768.1 hypothetical protein [Pseudenhygromyxa sp. WMMC2535]
MRGALPALAALLVLAACPGETASDPLDPELVSELSGTQGSAEGSGYAGSWRMSATQHECDCPSVEFDGDPIDLCILADLGAFSNLELEIGQVDGYLGATLPSDIVLTGPVEANGAFTLAGVRNLSTAAGTLQAIIRIDGSFPDLDNAEGDAAQRFVGEFATEAVDCRWQGELSAERS